MEITEWLGDNKLSLDIWRNKYQYKDETFEEWLDRVSGNNPEIKRLIKEKKFLFGGRTLSNRGVPNSGSFSNCYSIGFVPDSLDGIMDVAHKIAMTFKYVCAAFIVSVFALSTKICAILPPKKYRIVDITTDIPPAKRIALFAP